MRKYLLALVTVFAIAQASASVGAYTFASSAGNYVAISGTTFLSGSWDDGSSSLITMPFSFTYNGTSYTTLSINANGYITLGAVNADVYCGLQTSPVNSIAGYGTDLVGASAGSSIQYTTRGTAPNRQFVIQWADCDHYNTGNVNHWNFQIILNETTNTVQVVWGSSTDVTTMGANTCADAATESGSVGLLGASVSDFNVRSVTNGTNTWATSIAGQSLNAVCNMSSTNIPANGLTFTWTPGAAVAMSYVSSTTLFLNNGSAIPANSTSNQVLQVQIVTTGTATPLSLTSLSLSTTGCTNPSTDIANAKVYYTGNSNSFSTTTQFGTTFTNPNGAYTISGSTALSEGTNYFWVTYDLKTGAVTGDIIAGCCTQLTGSGTMSTQTPTVTCPSGSQTVSGPVGSWTQVTTAAPHISGGLTLLLSDGTILAKTNAGGGDGIGNTWDKLTPDANGSYINGTWSSITPMNNTRLYFSSQVLKDGRVYVAGGEYGTGLATGEVYDPLTNAWTMTPAPGQNVSDANSEILEDGRVLQALVAGTLRGTLIYNPATNTYAAGPTCLGIHNESAWIKLQDNSVLFVDRLSTNSERYIPSLNSWVSDATVPVALYDGFGLETGGAVLLPDGRAFFLGSTGHTAYYTPSGNNTPGTWAAGPDVPSGRGAPDGPMAMMVNGKVLCVVSPAPTSANHFPSPSYFYEFNYLTNTFTLLNAPGGGASLNNSTYVMNMLALPDGRILYSKQGSSVYYVYTPNGAALAAGKPTVSTVSQVNCNTYKLTGTQFNGISQGASYGDDWQMNTNYPIVRLTSGSNVYYARTFNWNSTGVRRGVLPDTTSFTLPAGLPAGTYSLVVVANGISSDPVSFTPAALPALSSTLTPSAICSNTAFTYSPTSSSAGATFTWTRPAVAGISNAAVTTPQASNPNEVLINTTSSPVNVVYVYVITAGGCSNTQNVTVTVKPTSSSTTTASVCSNLLPYVWNGNNYTATGSYVVHFTNATGCDSAATLNLTVKQTSSSTTTASVCSNLLPYVWNGNNYTATGSYIVHLTNAAGCDSAATLNLTVNQTSSSTTTTSVCSNLLPYVWNGNNYTATGSYVIHLTNAAGCDSAATLSLTVNQQPVVNAGSYGPVDVASAPITLTGTPAGGTFSGTGVSGNSFNPATAGAGTFTITYTYTDGSTGCSNSATTNITVTSICNFSVDTIVGPVNACRYMGLTGDTASYSIIAVNQNSFSWSVSNPATMQIIGSNTGNSVRIIYSSTFTNGTISVLVGSSCTSSITRTMSISKTIPAVPASISGPTNACSFIGTSTQVTYSIAPVVNALTYTWTMPANVSLISGQGTTSVQVIFNTGYTAAAIKVKSVSGCGSSADRSLTIATTAPATPGVITGPTNACIYIGTADSATYTIRKVANTTSYIWSLPPGVTLVSHPANIGLNDTIIRVSFNSSFVVPAVISVQATSVCGTSVARNLTINKTLPSTPGTMTGPTDACPLMQSATNPTGTQATYTIRKTNNATSYNWTVPAGVNIDLRPGLGTINDTMIVVTYTSSYMSGFISVQPVNGCGVGPSRSLTIARRLPVTPSAISGPTDACPIMGTATNATYTIKKVNYATSYLWTIPAGATLISHPNGSGPDDTAIVINYTSAFVSGSVTVKAIANCGTSGTRSLTISKKVPGMPGVITATAPTICPDRQVTYTINPVVNATSYIWSVPAGANILSGQGTTSVLVSYPTSAISNGSVKVSAANNCVTSSPRTLVINMAACPPVIAKTTIIANDKIEKKSSEISGLNALILPNPSEQEFSISIRSTDIKQPIQMTIADMNGHIIERKDDLRAGQLIRVGSNYTQGVYVLRLLQGDKVKILRLVKL